MKKWLFNPFLYIAGTQSLLIGWAIMLANAAIAVHCNVHFDGIVDFHKTKWAGSFTLSFLEQLIDWGSLILLLYSAALIWSKSSIRFIDVAGTLALARWPMLLCAVVGFWIGVPPHIGNLNDSAKVWEILDAYTGSLAIGLFVVLPLTIWMVALMYNAFRVSCNLKGQKATGIFIGVLVIAEILSHIILYYVYKQFI